MSLNIPASSQARLMHINSDWVGDKAAHVRFLLAECSSLVLEIGLLRPPSNCCGKVLRAPRVLDPGYKTKAVSVAPGATEVGGDLVAATYKVSLDPKPCCRG